MQRFYVQSTILLIRKVYEISHGSEWNNLAKY